MNFDVEVEGLFDRVVMFCLILSEIWLILLLQSTLPWMEAPFSVKGMTVGDPAFSFSPGAHTHVTSPMVESDKLDQVWVHIYFHVLYVCILHTHTHTHKCIHTHMDTRNS